MTHYNLCDSCETVVHCLEHGCVPLQSVDWEAVAADQAMTIALLKAEQPAQQQISDRSKQQYIDRLWARSAHGTLREDIEAAFEAGANFQQPAQQEPVAFSQFLSDVVTAAGLLANGKTDKSLAARISEFAFRLRTSPPAQRKPLTSEQIEKLCPQFEDPMRREMWIIGFKAAHNIKD